MNKKKIHTWVRESPNKINFLKVYILKLLLNKILLLKK